MRVCAHCTIKCETVRATFTSYTITTTITTLTPRVTQMNTLTHTQHTYARILHACADVNVVVFFMNENLTVYEPCGCMDMILFALVLCASLSFSVCVFFSILKIRSSYVFFLFSFASVWNSSHSAVEAAAPAAIAAVVCARATRNRVKEMK